MSNPVPVTGPRAGADLRALRQQRKVTTPRRAGKGGRRNISRHRTGRKRVFVQRHQVIAVVSALGRVAGEQPDLLAAMRLGRHTLLEMVVDRVAKCAGGIVVLAAGEGVEAATKLVGHLAHVAAAETFALESLISGIVDSQAPVLMLHDLAFPFAAPPLMTRLALAALEHGGAVAVGPADLAVGEVNDGLVLPPVGGPHLQPVCMPQAFLREAVQLLYDEEGGDIPADNVWKHLQRRGELIQAVPNPRFNMRIGNSLDLLTARKVIGPWLANRGKSAAARTGPGPGQGSTV